MFSAEGRAIHVWNAQTGAHPKSLTDPSKVVTSAVACDAAGSSSVICSCDLVCRCDVFAFAIPSVPATRKAAGGGGHYWYPNKSWRVPGRTANYSIERASVRSVALAVWASLPHSTSTSVLCVIYKIGGGIVIFSRFEIANDSGRGSEPNLLMVAIGRPPRAATRVVTGEHWDSRG